MADTLGQVLSYIDEILPNKLNSTTKIRFVNDAQRLYWNDLTSTDYYDSLTTLSSQATYSLPTNVTFDMVVENGILISDSTEAVTSTHNFTAYEYAGADDPLTGTRYYDALDDNFGIYPIPSSAGYPIRVVYQQYPTLMASSDTATQFNFHQDYVQLIRAKALEMVAKSQKETDLANDYNDECRTLYRRMKLKTERKKSNNPRRTWKYAEWLR